MATNAQAQERKEGCLAQLRRFRILDMVSYNMVFYAQAQERKEAKIFVFFPKAINTLCFLLLLSKNRMAINTLASQNRIEWTAHSKGWMGLSPSASHYIYKNLIMAAGQRDDSCLFMAAFVLSVYVYLRIRGQPVYLYEGKERRRL